ncbi:MAG: dihydromethanopterin reductase (acceptor) [Methanosarcinales archaeon]|nr:dihydromethanopterin reductase (acceptor) [Methanosarcinales archaeon]
MRIAWAITGAGHFINDSFEVFRKLKAEHSDLKVSIFISGAGEEVLKMYGLLDSIKDVAPGGYMEEIFLERDQGYSYPKIGRFLMDKYDCLILTPATSNTVAKIANGIADTLVTNAVTQAVKGSVPVYVVPVDIAGVIRSELPYGIDRDLCVKCEVCPPRDNCPNHAITLEPQIGLLMCEGCGNCVELCQYGAIKGGEVELRVRDLDNRNVRILRGLDEITVLESPYDVLEIIWET